MGTPLLRIVGVTGYGLSHAPERQLSVPGRLSGNPLRVGAPGNEPAARRRAANGEPLWLCDRGVADETPIPTRSESERLAM